jgi:hypothetical protein
MKCQDARRTLSLVVDGKLALTEWAIIQGHMVECAECRKELDRLQALAGARTRARRLRAAVSAVVAAAAVVVAGGVYLYQEDVLGALPWSATPAPPRVTAPSVPAPARRDPIAPVVAPAPPSVSRPSPAVPARPKGAVEPAPWGTTLPGPDPVPRATRPAATAETPAEDRMPTTQARPPATPTAPPNAEAMPTQAPARPVPRRP